MAGQFDLLRYGDIPVPWTVAWSAERDGPFYVALDQPSGLPAVFAPERRGEGKPVFAKPHDQRLRRAMREIRCDLCGRPIAPSRTRISMSRWHKTDVGYLQTEPLLHRACAIVSLSFCPRLQAQMDDGTLRIRQVRKVVLACSFLTADAVREVTGEEHPDGAVMGALKYQVTDHIDRDLGWLLK